MGICLVKRSSGNSRAKRVDLLPQYHPIEGTSYYIRTLINTVHYVDRVTVRKKSRKFLQSGRVKGIL